MSVMGVILKTKDRAIIDKFKVFIKSLNTDKKIQ